MWLSDHGDTWAPRMSMKERRTKKKRKKRTRRRMGREKETGAEEGASIDAALAMVLVRRFHEDRIRRGGKQKTLYLH